MPKQTYDDRVVIYMKMKEVIEFPDLIKVPKLITKPILEQLPKASSEKHIQINLNGSFENMISELSSKFGKESKEGLELTSDTDYLGLFKSCVIHLKYESTIIEPEPCDEVDESHDYYNEEPSRHKIGKAAAITISGSVSNSDYYAEEAAYLRRQEEIKFQVVQRKVNADKIRQCISENEALMSAAFRKYPEIVRIAANAIISGEPSNWKEKQREILMAKLAAFDEQKD